MDYGEMKRLRFVLQTGKSQVEPVYLQEFAVVVDELVPHGAHGLTDGLHGVYGVHGAHWHGYGEQHSSSVAQPPDNPIVSRITDKIINPYVLLIFFFLENKFTTETP